MTSNELWDSVSNHLNRRNVKKIALILIVVGILATPNLFLAYKDSQEQKQDKNQEVEPQVDKLINEFANKYGAVTDWQEELNYTLEAQEKLISDKPILFNGFVDDIFKRDDRFFVRFFTFPLSYSVFTIIGYDYVLELECDRSLVDKIFAQTEVHGSKYTNEYAVVANIDSVSKPSLVFTEDENVVVLHSSELLFARGFCVDIAHIDR